MLRVFIPILVGAAVFVWLTSDALPAVVASHFTANGAANGFMPRGAYVAVMLGVTIVVPLLIALSGRFASMLPIHLVNLPNRRYWLAPERRAATLASLSELSVYFASALLVFLCFVHWLVVRANESQPPHLESAPFLVGLALFVATTIVWLVVLLQRFRRVP